MFPMVTSWHGKVLANAPLASPRFGRTLVARQHCESWCLQNVAKSWRKRERERERERGRVFWDVYIFINTSKVWYIKCPLSIENNIDASLSWTKNNGKNPYDMDWWSSPNMGKSNPTYITVMWSSCDLGYPLGTGRLQDCGSASGRPWNGPQSVEVSLVIWSYGLWSCFITINNQQMNKYINIYIYKYGLSPKIWHNCIPTLCLSHHIYIEFLIRQCVGMLWYVWFPIKFICALPRMDRWTSWDRKTPHVNFFQQAAKER